MTCAEAEPLVGASLDGELDSQTALRIDEHFSTCHRCSVLLDRLQRLQQEISAAELDWSANADLRPLRAAIRRRTGKSWWRVAWPWRIALVTVAAVLVAMVAIPGRSGNLIERQMVDNHLRSMLVDHLVDVPSSDHHTVKPWFQGKLNFAPPVPELSADGFTLIGGRLDVVGGRPAAAIVYRRRQHVVNLWIMAVDGAESQLKSSDVEGFHILQWRKSGMAFWAVSDLNPAELREFAMLIRAH
jgi:anti-sigma factor RsiW